MKTLTPTQKTAARITSSAAQAVERKQSFLAVLRGMPAAINRGMRLIRAYNDLDRMNIRTLQDLGTHYGELDRVLQGHRPRTDR